MNRPFIFNLFSHAQKKETLKNTTADKREALLLTSE